MNLSELAKTVSIKCKRGASVPWHKRDEWQQKSTDWRVTLAYQGRRMTLDFWMGSGHNGTAPDACDVINSLVSDASLADNDFEDFCSECGYDTDSRKAMALYNATVKEAERTRRLLGDDFEKFLEAENDI